MTHHTPPVPFAAALVLAALAPSHHAQSVVCEVLGSSVNDRVGRALAVIGDVDQDGVDDLAVGFPDADVGGSDTGMVLLVSGDDGATIRSITGPLLGEKLGGSVAPAGDLDGDGVPDLWSGALGPVVGFFNTQVRAISGQTGAILHTLVSPSGGTGFGVAITSIDDIDGDGVRDLVVGAPGTGQLCPSGAVHIYSGATAAPLQTIVGTVACDQLGISVAALGDIDGDGRGDFAAGADGQPVLAAHGTGHAIVFTGQPFAAHQTFNGAAVDDVFGAALANAGDVDLDGSDDLLIGAPQGVAGVGGAGYAVVVSPATGATLANLAGSIPFDRFGASVAGVPDMNNDGRPELAVGAPDALAGAGSLTVFDSSTHFVIESYAGGAVGDGFGTSVAPHDLTGTLFGVEFAVGSPGADPGGVSNAGLIRVWSRTQPVVAFGTGCHGLAMSWVGATTVGSSDFAIELSGGLSNVPAWLFFGLPSPQWGGVPLPWDLTSFGAPGCFLEIPITVSIPLATDAAGGYSIPLSVPTGSTLIGASFWFQGMASDPGANALGVTTSNAIQATVFP